MPPVIKRRLSRKSTYSIHPKNPKNLKLVLKRKQTWRSSRFFKRNGHFSGYGVWKKIRNNKGAALSDDRGSDLRSKKSRMSRGNQGRPVNPTGGARCSRGRSARGEREREGERDRLRNYLISIPSAGALLRSSRMELSGGIVSAASQTGLSPDSRKTE